MRFRVLVIFIRSMPEADSDTAFFKDRYSSPFVYWHKEPA